MHAPGIEQFQPVGLGAARAAPLDNSSIVLLFVLKVLSMKLVAVRFRLFAVKFETVRSWSGSKWVLSFPSVRENLREVFSKEAFCRENYVTITIA